MTVVWTKQSMEKDNSRPNDLRIIGYTSEIVASFVSNNTVKVTEISGLIDEVYKTIQDLAKHGGESDRPEPAVSIKKSVTPNYLICLEDGRKLKMLKRHLRTAYNMTPDEYRERWGLPHDYPMVAPNYADRRRDLAKKIGLGTKNRS